MIHGEHQPRISKRKGRNAAPSDSAPGHQFSGGGNFTPVKRRAFCVLVWLICALRRSNPSNQRPSTVAKLFASVVPGRANASQLRPTRIISRGKCWCGFGTSAASLVILQVDDDDQLSEPTATKISGGSALLKVWDYCFVESLNNTVLRGCPIAW